MNNELYEHGELKESIEAARSLMKYLVERYEVNGDQLSSLDISVLAGFAIPAFRRYLEDTKAPSLDRAFHLKRGRGNPKRKALDETVSIAAFVEQRRRKGVDPGKANEEAAKRYGIKVKTVEAERTEIEKLHLREWLENLSDDHLGELIPPRRSQTGPSY